MWDSLNNLHYYGEHVWSQRDSRTKNWFMVNPIYTIVFSAMYIIVASFLGQIFMKERKPYNIKRIIIVYNFCMVWINIWIFSTAFNCGWIKYNWICEPRNPSTDEESMKMANAVYWYFLTKFIDWCDSIFFIMTKKFTHLSFLHIYHHGIMPFNALGSVCYGPVGHTTFPILVNSFIHTIMYSYYFLSAIDGKIQVVRRFKKYITRMQLMQFAIVGIHQMLPLLIECDSPKGLAFHYVTQALFFGLLFIHFYVQAYRKPKSA